ncbi:MAG: DNA repair protein RecO [Acidobacteriaceae bacterium]
MTLHQSEAIVLRTWPMRESDLLVSLLTRDLGKVRGVAKAAMKSRKRFGGALEPMTYVYAAYAERPRQELVRMDQFEAIASPLAHPVDYLRAATLAYYAEVLENVLPDHDPQDAIFRLTLAVLEQSRVDHCWMPLTYFSLWITRLTGWLPETDRCTDCGERFADEAAYYHGLTDGLNCTRHKKPNSSMISRNSLVLAQRMLRDPIRSMAEEPWTRQSGQDLRRFLVRTLERHLERRLNSAAAFAHMGG